MSHESLTLEVGDLTVSYNRIPAIHHVGFTLEGGHCVGLFGPNGAGKSTLLKAIAGLLPRETGHVRLNGCSYHHEHGAAEHHRHKICYLPQKAVIDPDFPLTVEGVVEMGRYSALGWRKKFTAQDAAIVAQAMREMELEDIARRQISELSGGQQQRAFIARALAQESVVLLLDEPFAGLDRNSQDSLGAAFRRLSASGKLLVVSHHDLKNAAALFDRALLINGELTASGAVSEVLTDANVDRAFGTKILTAAEDHA